MRASLRMGAIATAVAMLLSTPAVHAADPVAGSAGVGDPYFPLDGNGGIDVQHYDIADSYRFSPARISGTTTLRVRATEPLSSFDLDLLLPVSAVSVDRVAAAWSRPNRHELVVRPAAPLARGQVFTVRVAYAGDPTTLSYAGESNWLADDSEVVAMNEPHMAPWWFASNDHPSDKATYDITVTTDAAKQVISNGDRVSRTVQGALATTHWRMRQPMATYLAFFAAGRYYVAHGTTAAGTPWTTAVSRRITGAELTRDQRLIRQSGAITDWLERELGPYPFSSTGGLVTRLNPGFALENQSRPTYPWTDHTTIVHELAHQWFGDSVSLRRWSDVWLNEGFATYLEQRYREAHGGMRTLQWLHRAYDARAGDRSFWSLRPAAPGPAHLWDDSVYERGAMTLAALRHRIGNPDFRRLLRTWVSLHRGGNGTTAQFQGLAHRISGEHLGGFFKAWLHTGTQPRRTSANGW